MRTGFDSRFDFTAAAAGWRAQAHLHRAVLALVVVLGLAARSLAIDSRHQEQAQPSGAPPDLQITQVRPLAPLSSNATTDVEVRWTAQVPRLTTLEEFDVVLEVRYTDGSRFAARSEHLKPSARSAILQVATHPRQKGKAVLKDFKATVKANFRIASSFTVAQQLTVTQPGSFRARAGSSSASQPEVYITAATLVAQGCSPGRQCVDLKWNASTPRNITITEFTASLDARHKNGTHRADSKTVSGTERQARLSIPADGSEVESFKLNLLIRFYSLDSKTVVKEGVLARISFGPALTDGLLSDQTRFTGCNSGAGQPVNEIRLQVMSLAD
jgi:hypothetical protein